jgi:hypothetical protein
MKPNGNGAKPWVCENGHWLGQTVRAEVNKDGRKIYVTRLNLFRHAIDTKAERPEEVDVVAVLEGTVPVVQCDVPGCGASRSWFIGEGALEHLLMQRKEVIRG